MIPGSVKTYSDALAEPLRRFRVFVFIGPFLLSTVRSPVKSTVNSEGALVCAIDDLVAK